LLALNFLALGKHDNVKLQLMREEIIDLSVSLLKTNGNESSLNCLFLLGSMAENDEVRAVFITRGCTSVVVEMLKLDKVEVKRAAAYILALFAEQRDSHQEVCKCGILEAIISIASTPDGECQEYGSSVLVHLSGNPELQLQLARLGGYCSFPEHKHICKYLYGHNPEEPNIP